jgi:two-component system sensor histidine kinase VicK
MNTDPRFSSEELLKVLSLSHNATAIHTSMALTVQMANDAMLAIWGKDKSVIGLSLEEALPELKGQPFIGMMQNVLQTGISHQDVDTPANLVVNGRFQTFYFDFEYRAIKNEQGETYCILHTATDVTQEYLNRQALLTAQKTGEALAREQALNEELATTIEELSATNEELKATQHKLLQLNTELEDRVQRRTAALAESEANFRNMILQAPVAIGLFNGYYLVL